MDSVDREQRRSNRGGFRLIQGSNLRLPVSDSDLRGLNADGLAVEVDLLKKLSIIEGGRLQEILLGLCLPGQCCAGTDPRVQVPIY